MKTIIAGSRTCTDSRFVETAILESGFAISEVVCGMAKGPDLFGWEWAKKRSIPVKFFKPQWRVDGVYKARAGKDRNIEMAEYAEALIAVWDGKSTGTNHMIVTAKKYGLKVFIMTITSNGGIL